MSVLVSDFNKVKVMVNVNFTLEQAMKTQMEVEVKIYSFFNFGARWGERSTPRPGQFTPWKDSVQIVQEAGWVPEPVRTGAEYLAPTGIRSPDRPAHSEPLYILSYPTILTKLE